MHTAAEYHFILTLLLLQWLLHSADITTGHHSGNHMGLTFHNYTKKVHKVLANIQVIIKYKKELGIKD